MNKPDQRPNILLILSDNQRLDGLGCAGHPHCRTPTWDRIAAEGVFFEGVRTTSPVCSPARASLWTGLEPHRAGLTTVIHAVSPEKKASELEGGSGMAVPPSPMRMREAGYQTFLAGKWHVGDHWQEKSFDHAEACDFQSGDYSSWCRKNGFPDGFVLRDPLRAKPFRSPRFPHMSVPHVAPLDIPESAEYNRWILERGLSLLDKVDSRRPWFFNLSFYGVHPPFFLSEEVLARYKKHLPEPPANWRPAPGEPGLYAQSYYRREWSEWGEDFEAWREAIAASWAYTSYIDGLIGEFVQAAEARGMIDENTLVVLASDHGDMMGQHGLWQKFCPYEEAVRVPVVLKWGRRLPSGHRVSTGRSLKDLGNTLLEAAGLETAGPGLLQDGNHPEERDTFVQYDQPSDWNAWHPVPPWRTICRKNWKFTAHGNGEEELYNLAQDPGEMHNLVAVESVQGVRSTLREALITWRRETGDTEMRHQHGNPDSSS